MVKSNNIFSIIIYLSLCAANCSGKAVPSSSKTSSQKGALGKNDLMHTTASGSLEHNGQGNGQTRDQSFRELERNDINDKFREQGLESPVATDGEQNSSFYASELFLKNLRKINKYKKIVPIKQCNHDEKDHTSEERELMNHFSKAMLDATNKFRTNPEYFLKKIEKKRDYIVNNFINNELKTSYFVKNKIINGRDTKIYMDIKEANAAAYNDAIQYLKEYINSKNRLKPYKHYEPLVKSTLLHAKAMCKHDFYGHTGVCSPIYIPKNKYKTDEGAIKHPKGSSKSWVKNYESSSNRITLFTKASFVAENIGCCGLDYEDLPSLKELAEDIIMGYFIDDGVEDRGHRTNLMNDKLTHFGASIYEHPIHNDKGSQYYVHAMNFCIPA